MVFLRGSFSLLGLWSTLLPTLIGEQCSLGNFLIRVPSSTLIGLRAEKNVGIKSCARGAATLKPLHPAGGDKGFLQLRGGSDLDESVCRIAGWRELTRTLSSSEFMCWHQCDNGEDWRLPCKNPECSWCKNIGERRVYEMEVDVSGTGIVPFNPGDCIGIRCPNPKPLAKGIASVLSERAGGAAAGDSEEQLEFLTSSREVAAVSRVALKALAMHCSDTGERIKMQTMAGPEGWAVMREEHLDVLDVLQRFASCAPSLQQLIEVLPPLSPR